MAARPGYAGDLQTRLLNLSVRDPLSGCWLWIGARIYNRRGFPYGSIKVDGKSQLAHRVSFKAFKGRALPKNKTGSHQCNNTLCINPDHLKSQSQKKNIQYAAKLGRLNGQHAASGKSVPFNFAGVAPCIRRFI